jgi:hypothetical protein
VFAAAEQSPVFAAIEDLVCLNLVFVPGFFGMMVCLMRLFICFFVQFTASSVMSVRLISFNISIFFPQILSGLFLFLCTSCRFTMQYRPFWGW